MYEIVLKTVQEVFITRLYCAGSVYHEGCNCPMSSLSKWMDTMRCPKNYKQIDLDLLPFPVVDMEQVEKEAVSRFSSRGSHSLCHYVIKDNKVTDI